MMDRVAIRIIERPPTNAQNACGIDRDIGNSALGNRPSRRL